MLIVFPYLGVQSSPLSFLLFLAIIMNIEYLDTILVEVNALTGIIDRSDGYVSLPCPHHHDYKPLPTKTTVNSGGNHSSCFSFHQLHVCHSSFQLLTANTECD